MGHAVKKSTDQKFCDDLEKLQGEKGIQILVNDRKDVVSQIIKALNKVDCLPEDLDYPETLDEVWAVNFYASTLYDLFCKGADIAEGMMVGDLVEKKYNDIQEEKGNTRDAYKETGHGRGDF